MKPAVNLLKLGRLPYVEALNIQQILFNRLKNDVAFNDLSSTAKYMQSIHKLNVNPISCLKPDIPKSSSYSQSQCIFPNSTTDFQTRNSLLLVEHEPVYTIGIRNIQYNEDYVTKLKRRLRAYNLEADFVKTNRGGLITFHGPGQLVAYPIIYLGDFKNTIQDRSVKAYVKVLERTIIDTLAKVGLNGAHTVKGYPGVWLEEGERKIAFIGISCKRFVTMHGISINCDCDLSWFDHIVSCGIEDKRITSVRKEMTHELPSIGTIESRVSNAFCSSFSQNFDCILTERDPNLLSIDKL